MKRNKPSSYAKDWIASSLALLLTATGGTALAEKPAGLKGHVARAVVTSGIHNREPVDRLAVVDSRMDEVNFFTELRDLQGHTIVHRWKYKGEIQAETEFEIKGPRTQVYSTKSLDTSQLGEWNVLILDKDSGWPLQAEIFIYGNIQ